MTQITAKNAGRQDFIPLMQELVKAYQAFAAYDTKGYRDIDLTVSQADVIFTLGNTDGLTFKDIGKRTLITKGTLTGVIDRLEKKQLIQRYSLHEDRRSTLVTLTQKGQKMFEEEFPRQIHYLKKRFDQLSQAEQSQALNALQKISKAFG